jgi:hypothetical protein
MFLNASKNDVNAPGSTRIDRDVYDAAASIFGHIQSKKSHMGELE